jgi:uncharacterized membrane protein (DUF485 family)
MTITETWNNLCTPAQLYFIMTAIGFLLTAWGFPKALNISNVMYQTLITLIWTYLLGWICTKGWTGLSWFLVIAPFILSMFVMYTLYTMKNNLERAAQQKAAQKKVAVQKEADIDIDDL